MDKADSKLVSAFESRCISENLSQRRVKKYRYTLCTLSKMLGKPFAKADSKDMEKLLVRINQSEYSPWTKKDFRITIRKFWHFLGKDDMVSWVKTTIKRKEIPMPDLLTREELTKLISACKTVRDKALLFTLYESGARIDELLSVKLSEVEFDSYGAILIINNSKTKSRRIRICGKAVVYLREWVEENHPTKEPDSKLFPITYNVLRLNLQRLVKRAGIRKRVHFHMFRHGRATELAKELTEAELSIVMGWEIGGQMPRTYVHLSGKDIDRKMLQIAGVTKEQKLDDAMSKLKVGEPELYKAIKRFVSKELKASGE